VCQDDNNCCGIDCDFSNDNNCAEDGACRVIFCGSAANGLFHLNPSSTNIIGSGEYPQNEVVFPEAVATSFDSLFVDYHTRLQIWDEPNFQGDLVFDQTGPWFMDNCALEYYYGPNGCSGNYYNYFPCSAGWQCKVSDMAMYPWSYGSSKITCESVCTPNNCEETTCIGEQCADGCGNMVDGTLNCLSCTGLCDGNCPVGCEGNSADPDCVCEDDNNCCGQGCEYSEDNNCVERGVCGVFFNGIHTGCPDYYVGAAPRYIEPYTHLDDLGDAIGQGEFSNNSLIFPNASANTFDSLVVENGTTLELWPQPNFQGAKETFVGPLIVNHNFCESNPAWCYPAYTPGNSFGCSGYVGQNYSLVPGDITSGLFKYVGGSARVTCMATSCGDGHLDMDTGEECDDGNTTNGDGCSSACQKPQNCDEVCTSAIGCDGGFVCSSGRCRDSGCASDPACTCTCIFDTSEFDNCFFY